MLIVHSGSIAIDSVSNVGEPDLIQKIDRLNKAITALGRTCPVVFSERPVNDLIMVQNHYKEAKIIVCTLPSRPDSYYMAIEVDKVRLLSVDCYS